MANITITACQTLPAKDTLNDVLAQYYALVVKRMAAIGIAMDPAAPQSALAEFWAHADDYLPPDGCLLIAQTPKGDVVGCGMLKRLDATTGELKRVFVTDAARGLGVGRALIQAREQAARDMGLKRLVADTLTASVEMRSLYPKLGFVELETPLETTTYKDQPSLRPYLHFFAKDL